MSKYPNHSDHKRAHTFAIGSNIQYVRGITGSRNPIWAFGTVYRKTKNFVFVQTKTKKVKFENDSWLFDRI